jgi:predicted ABC-type ATPase
MASLLIVTGPPGAGKSTVSAILANRMSSSVLVEGDRFFGFLAKGSIEPWLPEAHNQNGVVTEAAAAATGRFAADYHTVYDGVVGPWFLPTFTAASGLVELDYVVLLPSVDQCISQVGSRSGHGFTDVPATRKMHHEFSTASIHERHVIAGHPTNPEHTADQIETKRARGELRYRASANRHPN